MRPGQGQLESPAARFEAAMDPRARRQAGAHYTCERDILRVIEPLFLAALRADVAAAVQEGEAALRELLARLQRLRFLDPACGCGDFLVVTLRQLREVELAALLALRSLGAAIEGLARVGCGQMVGIELDAVAAGIAREALARVDAEMDAEMGAAGLGPPVRVAGGGARIVVGNALRVEWTECLPAEECAYVLGNPPFVGKKEQSPQQKEDMARVWQGVRGAGVLDLASCWFRLAARYIAGTAARVGFVATSSIAQGEQVAALWGELLAQPGLHLQFAGRSFPWGGAARGRAQVHVVVIGFGCQPTAGRFIVEHGAGRATVTAVREISPYLVAGGATLIRPRRRPISAVPELVYGSFALDDGHYTLDAEQRAALLRECPEALRFLRSFVGGRELLHGEPRYCLWLQGAETAALERLPAVKRRVAAVAAWRAGRGRALTRALAATPTRFAEVRQPEGAYLAIPTTSSERRRYLPIGFLGPEVIASNQLYIMPGATNYEFGVLQSAMHMAWARQVCGRLKSDLRYSNAIVYNNFPWPAAGDEGRAAVAAAAAEVLAARAGASATLAALYDVERMPPALGAAHARLDAAVDRCYGAAGLDGDRARVELLFALYERATGGA